MSETIDAFWIERRAAFLAKLSSHADPAACGTCRANAEAGQPVEHDECQQRATLLQAPDHPDYEILAGFSAEENAKLPARFHIPVFDDCGVPNAWLCAVCWEEGVVSQWPCKTANEQGTKVFTPLHTAETAANKQTARTGELESALGQVTAEIASFGIYGAAVPATKALVKRADELVNENASLRARIAELTADLAAVSDAYRAELAQSESAERQLDAVQPAPFSLDGKTEAS